MSTPDHTTTYEKILEKTHAMPRAQLIDTLVKAMEFCGEYELLKVLAHINVTGHVTKLPNPHDTRN